LKKLAIDYKNAMGELVKRHPDELDAATLYAEGMMDLRPWRLWNKDGTAAEGTEEIVSVLESVLKRNPNHIGANHYHIRAVEASLHPERALPSAERPKTLAPGGAGHLIHMPTHIYMRTGDYTKRQRKGTGLRLRWNPTKPSLSKASLKLRGKMQTPNSEWKTYEGPEILAYVL